MAFRPMPPRAVPVCLAGAVLLCLPAAARAQAETDLSAAEIDALLGRLVDPADMAVRAAALDQLCEAQAGALPLLAERLFRPNGIANGLQQRLVEDYLRRLPAELPPESPVPRRTALAPLLHVLILAPHETYRESWAAVLQTSALLAALDAIDSSEALMEVIRFVGQYEGAYARPAGLVVRSKGDRAIPALVLSRRVQDGTVKQFIATQLARMGKERAPLMAQTDDDQLLADILRAIAEVKDAEGVNVMLSFINSDRPFVRRAARESLLRYERNAIWAVRKSYEDLTGERADTSWDWRETMDRLFAAQDAARLEPLDALLAQGLAAARDGRYAEMDEAFGAILGREPEYPRRAEMIPGLLAYGEKLLADGNVLEARRILRLTGYLIPEGDARAARVRAHLAYLEGLRRRDLGFPDPAPFREAATLDPGYRRLIASRDDLARLAGAAEGPASSAPAAEAGPAGAAAGDRNRSMTGRLAAAGGILLAALAALALLLAAGRTPGRLFRPSSAGPGGAADAGSPAAEDPVPPRRAGGFGSSDPGSPPAAAERSVPGAAAVPVRPVESGVEDAVRPAAAGTEDAEQPVESGVEDAVRPAAAGTEDAERPVESGLEDKIRPAEAAGGGAGDPGGSSAAPASVPEDPYRRIELALARLRTDAAALAEPPDAPDAAGRGAGPGVRKKDGKQDG
ncbi:MAG: hypothetical protein GYA57_13775 [Myxococcales bacterium]|nr:hypothetical protein [Myxococcales bacterium]